MEGKQAMSRGNVLLIRTAHVGIVLSLVMAITAPATALDMVWMRHEPGDNALDQYGHDGGPAIPEVDSNLNGRGVVVLGNNVFLDVVPLASGGYVWARDDINVNNNDHNFDSFVHDADMNEIADSNNTRGINGDSYRGMVGLSSGNYVWARADPDMEFFVHSGTTAEEIAFDRDGRVPGTYVGMAPVASGNFVWGQIDNDQYDWFLHSGTDISEIHSAIGTAGVGTGGFLGVAALANGNFVFGRSHDEGQGNGEMTDWIIRDGTDLSLVAQANQTAGTGDNGVMGVIGLANGNFVWVRDHAGAYDLKLHSGTTGEEIALNHGVRGSNATFLGLAALPDGSFVMARLDTNADENKMDLFQYSGTTLAEIGVRMEWRGVGVGGDLFDGIAGLTAPESLLPGDANGDGCVDDLDLTALAVHWQQATSDWDKGDFNGDGIVDDLDLTALAVNWQQGCGGGGSLADALAAANVPEPSTIVLLIAAAAVIRRRRRSWTRPACEFDH